MSYPARGLGISAAGHVAVRPQGLGYVDPRAAAVEVVDGPRAVGNSQAGRVEADALRCTTDDKNAGAGPCPQLRDHGAPGVGEVVRRGGDTQRVEAVGEPDEHVTGVRDADQVTDHAAVGTAGRSEPEGRQDTFAGGGAFRGQPAQAVGTLPAGDRLRNHDLVADLKTLDV